MSKLTWREAMQEALYGPDGFFVRERPADHFRTSVAFPAYAEAVRVLAGRVDTALGRPDPFDLVDVGAGRGELLAALPDVPARWRLTGVEVGPADVPHRWLRQVPPTQGLLFANEWLDVVPLDVVQDGRVVLVDRSGEESPGPPSPYAGWCDRWWPGGGRVEVGLSRDRAWAAAVAQLTRGMAVAVDYGHTRADRRTTLTGYRRGRQVEPVPDGSCDLTAHVALDSCAATTGAQLLTQREALRALGVTADTGDLQRRSQVTQLLDPAGLGGFGWLVQVRGINQGVSQGIPAFT